MPNLDQSLWMDYQAIYVHIPFCRQKCIYCDFASYAGCTDETMQAYTEALCHEIEVRAASEKARVNPRATIYFGGGTPSVLPTEYIAKIVNALKINELWQSPAEATIEVNPGTANLEKLRALRQIGFDRISFGVQSLDNAELKTIGRIHNAQQALQAIQWARQAGFKRISCDLIYGLPGQTLNSLQRTMHTLLSADIDHISVYGLQVEEGTPLEYLLDSGKLTLPSEDVTADMYEAVQRYLKEQGFTRYEISNYAKPNQQSLHNTVYWQYHPYLAFGAAATGFDGKCRRSAIDGVEEYIQLVNKLTAENWQDNLMYEIEVLSAQEKLAEFMFMGLRQSRGADLTEAQKRFGIDVMQSYKMELEPWLQGNYLVWDRDEQILRLTEQGMEIGNQIFSIFV